MSSDQSSFLMSERCPSYHRIKHSTACQKNWYLLNLTTHNSFFVAFWASIELVLFALLISFEEHKDQFCFSEVLIINSINHHYNYHDSFLRKHSTEPLLSIFHQYHTKNLKVCQVKDLTVKHPTPKFYLSFQANRF